MQLTQIKNNQQEGDETCQERYQRKLDKLGKKGHLHQYHTHIETDSLTLSTAFNKSRER